MRRDYSAGVTETAERTAVIIKAFGGTAYVMRSAMNSFCICSWLLILTATMTGKKGGTDCE